jgi:hypothetical protein
MITKELLTVSGLLTTATNAIEIPEAIVKAKINPSFRLFVPVFSFVGVTEDFIPLRVNRELYPASSRAHRAA